MTNREKYNVIKIVSRRESDWRTDNHMWNTSEVWYAYDPKGACCKQTATYEEMKEWLDFEENEKIKLNEEERTRLRWLIEATEHVDDVIFRPATIERDGVKKFVANAYADRKFEIYVDLDVPFEDIEWGDNIMTFEEFNDFVERTFEVE